MRPGGAIVMSTLNRTLKCYALAIVGAEYILGWLPRGTHDWNRFVTTDELSRYLAAAGFSAPELSGIVYDVISDTWRLGSDTDVNYIASAEDVRIGSPKVYAAIHQLGGTIQKPEGTRYMVGRRFAKRDKEGGKDVKIRAHTITIPARPYIGISPADEEGILEDAQDWLTR